MAAAVSDKYNVFSGRHPDKKGCLFFIAGAEKKL